MTHINEQKVFTTAATTATAVILISEIARRVAGEDVSTVTDDGCDLSAHHEAAELAGVKLQASFSEFLG